MFVAVADLDEVALTKETRRHVYAEACPNIEVGRDSKARHSGLHVIRRRLCWQAQSPGPFDDGLCAGRVRPPTLERPVQHSYTMPHAQSRSAARYALFAP